MSQLVFAALAGYLLYKSNQSGGWGALSSEPNYYDPIGTSDIQEQQRDIIGEIQRFGEQPDPRSDAWEGQQSDLARRVSEVPAANAFINSPGYKAKFDYMQEQWAEIDGQMWDQAASLNPLLYQVRSPSQPIVVSFRGSGM